MVWCLFEKRIVKESLPIPLFLSAPEFPSICSYETAAKL